MYSASDELSNPSFRLLLRPRTLALLAMILSRPTCASFLGVSAETALSSLDQKNTTRRLKAIENEDMFQESLASHLTLFSYSPEVAVIGPTSFVKPTDFVHYYGNRFRLQQHHEDHMDPEADSRIGSPDEATVRAANHQRVDSPSSGERLLGDEESIVPFVQPVLGAHRPDHDVVIAYAAEYQLRSYVLFIESLLDTGYAGDIVLAVHELDLQQSDIREYLQYHATHSNLIVYAPPQMCYNAENEQVDSIKGGTRTCHMHNLYGIRSNSSGAAEPLFDPRPPRTVAVTRYELYWLFVQHYNPERWVLLVDARDTVFQSDPFGPVPRNTDRTDKKSPNESQKSGLLYFFGENVDATRLGKSKQNSKWLNNAYGEAVAQALASKPTICSGATMGEVVAVDTYLRAMVSEYDATGVVIVGADQGFHNYLYYSHKLANANAIHDIVVFDQGMGIVNNMGAMRTSPLDEWGNGQIVRAHKGKNAKDKPRIQILNWDGSISPVVHQFDRHKELSQYYFKERTSEYMQRWNDRRKQK
jgi:hypothetical protein